MEGVVDYTMRELLTRVGGVDRCVTEFVRVTNQRLPRRVFYRLCPELQHGGVTASGVPVYVQLLGGEPEPMAFNAAKAARLGALGIDINFGCPAKTVNRRDGGSVLLQYSERIHNIVAAVRNAVPSEIPVTVKIRLGFDDRSLFTDNVAAIESAGANELVIHARTKVDGYKPPAYWSCVGDIKSDFTIPMIINGEIWCTEHYRQAQDESGCEDIMLGRGLLTRPDLALALRDENHQAWGWEKILPLVVGMCELSDNYTKPRYVANRVKQWLAYLRNHYTEAAELFAGIKRFNHPADIECWINQQKNDADTLRKAS